MSIEYLRYGTTTYKPVGPFVEAASGTSMSTVATSTAADTALLVKHDSTAGTTMQSLTAWSSIALGYMLYPFTTGETDTVGPMKMILVDEDAYLPVEKNYYVLPQNSYDSLFGSSGSTERLHVDVKEINSTAVKGDGTASNKWAGGTS